MTTIDVTPGKDGKAPTFKISGYDKTNLTQRVAEESDRPITYNSVCRWLKKLGMGKKPAQGYTEDHVTLLVTLGRHLLLHDTFQDALDATTTELETTESESENPGDDHETSADSN